MPSILEIIGYVLMIAAYTFILIEKFGILIYIIVFIVAAIIYYFSYKIKLFVKPPKPLTVFNTNALIGVAFENLKSPISTNKITGFEQLQQLCIHDYDKVFKGLVDVLANEKDQDSRTFYKQCIFIIYEKKKNL